MYPPQQLERREPIHSMHENVWHYGAGGVWILILHVNIRMNVFIRIYYVATEVRIGYGWISRGSYSSNSFEVLCFCYVSGKIHHRIVWGSFQNGWSFNWTTTLCNYLYCYCQLLWNANEDPLVHATNIKSLISLSAIHQPQWSTPKSYIINASCPIPEGAFWFTTLRIIG